MLRRYNETRFVINLETSATFVSLIFARLFGV